MPIKSFTKTRLLMPKSWKLSRCMLFWFIMCVMLSQGLVWLGIKVYSRSYTHSMWWCYKTRKDTHNTWMTSCKYLVRFVKCYKACSTVSVQLAKICIHVFQGREQTEWVVVPLQGLIKILALQHTQYQGSGFPVHYSATNWQRVECNCKLSWADRSQC